MNKFNFTKEDFLEPKRNVERSGAENALSAYMSDIQYRMLTPEEELVVTKAAAAGNQEAKEILYLTNLRLVINTAKSYRYRGVEFIDLIQEGNLALMSAVENFDPSLKNKFSTYAYHWVKLSIARSVDDKSRAIRIPVYMIQNIIRVEEVAKKLEAELKRKIKPEDIYNELAISNDIIIRYKNMLIKNDIFKGYVDSKKNIPADVQSIILEDFSSINSRNGTKVIEAVIALYNKNSAVPSISTIAKRVNLSIKEIEKLLLYNNTISSLNTEINNSEGDKTELGTLIEDNNDYYQAVYQRDDSSEVSRVLDRLPEREAKIIRLRFGFLDGIEYTLEEIGERTNLSKERVRQIIKSQLEDEVFQKDLLQAMSYQVENTDNKEGFKLVEI